MSIHERHGINAGVQKLGKRSKTWPTWKGRLLKVRDLASLRQRGIVGRLNTWKNTYYEDPWGDTSGQDFIEQTMQELRNVQANQGCRGKKRTKKTTSTKQHQCDNSSAMISNQIFLCRSMSQCHATASRIDVFCFDVLRRSQGHQRLGLANEALGAPVSPVDYLE